ncbi:MarR family winged helix-turn-helix transcriptional regulator [Methanobrevibacter olleyae]|uniref:DNA-binding transcriptional regulator, MarR family n=1 Tax=Methanobrevibacter olleyae TaxID=294671 RepID=A0A126R1U9_METOL|nr:MarR family transcriptional regulator [Methanobrevibacter olleyae]AMK16052.1 MarR family transcriptional regulator [Methanobrevibacter olleyae]SFL49882.1 DNA-binding transcriptional regulator, MarR family [Methanobrevibacter olleyae]
MNFNEDEIYHSFLDDDIPSSPLISILYREHAKFINEIVKEDDLSFGLHPLLISIYKNDVLNQEQLAQISHLNESTITRNLKKLEDKGLIERIPHKRKKLIKTTEKGNLTAQKVMDYDEMWDEQIKLSLSDEEYNNFLNTLKKITHDLI